MTSTAEFNSGINSGIEIESSHVSESPITAPASKRARSAPSKWRQVLPTVLIYIASIAVALALCALLVSTTGGSAMKAVAAAPSSTWPS